MSHFAPCPFKCNFPVDANIQSSDGALQGAHLDFLEMFSEFTSYASLTCTPHGDSQYTIDESQDIVTLFIQFTHPNTHQPDVQNLSFDVVRRLAELVEKFQVYTAMQVCRLAMEVFSDTHPIEVLVYAEQHKRSRLAQLASLPALKSPLPAFLSEAMARGLAHHLILKWVNYRERWAAIHQSIIVGEGGGTTDAVTHTQACGCHLWKTFHYALIHSFSSGGNLATLAISQDVFNTHKMLLAGCTDCEARAEAWARKIGTAVASIPEYEMI